jgi:RNA polymerase sigma-70 factor (ECF subfamily)
VFVRLIRRGNTAEPLDNQESYLRRAAVNTAIDVVRSRQDSLSVPLEDAPSLPSPQAQATPELRDSLRRALATLSPRAAEVFALRYFEGYKNQEIAQMLGISQAQVAIQLFRTRKQLQKEIKSQSGVRR